MKRIVTCLENIDGGEKVAVQSLHKGLIKLKNKNFQFKLITYSHKSFSSYTNYFFASTFYLLRKVYKEKKDVLIVTAPHHFFVLLICSFKVKTVYFFHGDKSFHYNEVRLNTKNPLKLAYGYAWVKIQNFLFKSALQKVTLIFVPNQVAKSHLINKFSFLEPKRILIVPNGVDTQKFHPVSTKEKNILRKEVGLLPSKFVLSYIGRIDVLKRIDLLLTILKKSKIKISFLIIHPQIMTSAGRNYQLRLKEMIRDFELENSVQFIQGTYIDIEKWYQRSDCIVLPSLIEQSSMTVKEAMSCGVPIISSDTGDTSELLEHIDKRLVVKNPVPLSLEKSVTWFFKLNQKDKTVLGEKLNKAVRQYSIENSIEHFYSCLDLLSKNPDIAHT